MRKVLLLGMIFLLTGLIPIFFIEGNIFEFLTSNLILGLFISMPVFIVLSLFDKIGKLLGMKKDSPMPTLLTGYVSLVICLCGYFFLNNGMKTDLQSILNTTTLLCFLYVFSSLYISLYLLSVEKRKPEKTYEKYFMKMLIAEKVNKQNLPVTINNLKTPERYFEKPEYEECFNQHFQNILDVVEVEAKNAIFEYHLENETTGEWFISKIDLYDNNGFNPGLCFDMVFIKKEITQMSVNFVSLGNKVKLSDYCCVHCFFEFRYFDSENMFVFKETEVELL